VRPAGKAARYRTNLLFHGTRAGALRGGRLGSIFEAGGLSILSSVDGAAERIAMHPQFAGGATTGFPLFSLPGTVRMNRLP